MEKIFDVLYYLNKLDFTDKVNDDDYTNFRCVKRNLVREFEGFILNKLIHVLNLIAHLIVLIPIGRLSDVLDSTQTSRENSFLNQF